MSSVPTQKYQDVVNSVLEKAKQKGVQAEAVISIDSGISTVVRMGAVDTLEFHQDKLLGITVYKDHKKGSVTTTDISPEALESSLEAACRIAEYTEADSFSGLPEKEYLAKHIPDLDLSHPWEVTPEQSIEYAKQAEDAARAYDPRITNSDGATFVTHRKYRVLGNTLGFLGAYPSTRYALYCAVIAQQRDAMQRDQEYTVARDGHDLEPFAKVGEQAAVRALKRLNARKIQTTECPVIFSFDIAGTLFSSLIQAISGGNLYRKSSFLLDHLDKKIFPDFIQIEEVPHLPKGPGSTPFDHEGVATSQHDIIKNGILKSYVLSCYSARKLGLKPTGNAGGVHNLRVSHGNKSQDQLIKQMHKGLLVTELMGHGVNLVNGDYSRGAFGYWVENGEIQYPVEEITIAGNLKEMFMNLVEIGNDVEKRGNIQTGSVLLEKMMVAGA